MEHQDISTITTEQIRIVILNFLQARLDEKLKKEEKNLIKAQAANNQTEIRRSEQKIMELKIAFELDNWMDDAATRRINWMSISTHISKAIHPDSRGNNINYTKSAKPLSEFLVSSNDLLNPSLDATGNAAALDIFAFFNLLVSNTPLMQLIVDEHPALINSLSSDPNKGKVYLAQFRNNILAKNTQAITYERNKQILWPDIQHRGKYTCLIPLHPTSLCHQVYKKINHIKFSEETREAKENRKKKSAIQTSYPYTQNLGVVKLGGSNPQGVSQLTSAQGGKNYLLPNLPPKLTRRKEFDLSPTGHTFFEKSLRHECQEGWRSLKKAVNAKKSVMAVRDSRKQGIASIIMMVIALAEKIQAEKPAGWSKNHDELEMAQKYWLDPRRGDLLGEEVFKAAYDRGEWIPIVERTLALWLNDWLKQAFPKYALDFDDAEYQEWRRKMNVALRASQRRAGRIHL